MPLGLAGSSWLFYNWENYPNYYWVKQNAFCRMRMPLRAQTSSTFGLEAAASPLAPKVHSLLLLTCLFISELCIAVMSVAIYVKGDRPFTLFLSDRSGIVFLMAGVAFCPAAAVILSQYKASLRLRSRHFRLVVMMHLVMVVFILTTAEIAVRAGTNSITEGEIWRWRVLLPKSWAKVALYERELLNQRAGRLSYLVYDDLMGWSTGPNRRGRDGLYYSSWEGIRAPHEGVSFARSTDKTRIALVGDSFTFGDDVAYEDSWGYRLQKELGSKFEVLNFGVSGYGIDQAYLRYEKDVREWKPNIVIFGLVSDDFERTMRLYNTLCSWLDFPFSKPRFILHDGNLKKLNVTPLTPEDLFSRKSISELPFLEYDRCYKPSHWQFSFIHHSYLARALITLFPRWDAGRRDISDSALVSVNASILKAFVQSATSEGTIPIVAYFAQKVEFSAEAPTLPIGKKVLREAGVAYTDLTPCLMPMNPGERFVSKLSHYTPEGNARVAQCLLKSVHETMSQH